MPAFRLNHICHKPGCEGYPGEVIKVTNEDAAWLTGHGGGRIVGDELTAEVDATKPRRKTKKEELPLDGDDSTDTSNRAEN